MSNPVSVGDDLVERLRPKHIADEPLARAVVSQDQMERRRAVSAYLMENNALKAEAASQLAALREALAPFAVMAQCTDHTDMRDGQVVMRLQHPKTREWIVLTRADFRAALNTKAPS